MGGPDVRRFSALPWVLATLLGWVAGGCNLSPVEDLPANGGRDPSAGVGTGGTLGPSNPGSGDGARGGAGGMGGVVADTARSGYGGAEDDEN